jgi:ribonuclease P/MRP protein subunit POP1
MQYIKYSDDREQKEKEEWERKPPAKRVSYEKTGTRSPWKPDWNVVLGIQSIEDSEFIPSQREPEQDAEHWGSVQGTGSAPPPRETKKDVTPWLLRGGVLSSILNKISDMLNPAAGLLSEINQLRVLRHNDPLSTSVRAEHLWKGALVVVKLVLCGRGSPEDLGMIYQLENDEIEEWKRVEQMRQTATLILDEDDDDGKAVAVS